MNKSKKLKNIALLAGIVFSAWSCVDNQSFKVPEVPGMCSDIKSNSTFSKVLSQVDPTKTKLITDDISFTGYVISSDKGGNFFKSVVLQDNSENPTQGVEIGVDLKAYYDYLPVGSKVVVKAKGLYIAEDKGVIKLGAEKAKYPVERLDPKVFFDHVKRTCDDVQNIVPKAYTSIKEAKKAAINTLIRLDSVQFKDADGKLTFYDAKNSFGGATNTVIEDKEGNKLDLRNGQYTDWAKEVVPSKSGSITLVLSKYGSQYQGYIRSLDDLMLKNKRFTVKSGGSGSSEVVSLEASTATASDFVKGKKVALHGNLMIKDGRSWFKFSDGTEIQVYVKGYSSLSKEAKDKLNTEGQEVTITGEFGEHNTTKQIQCDGESSIVFGKTPDNGGGGSSGGNEPSVPVAGKMFDFENLTDLNNKYSTTGKLTTQSGVTLTFEARTDVDKYGIDGKGLVLKDNGTNNITIKFPKGVKKITLDYRGAFTSPGKRGFEVYNGTEKLGDKIFDKDDSGKYSLEINKTDDITIVIKPVKDSKQFVIDNIAWEENSNGGGGTPPSTKTYTFDFENLNKKSSYFGTTDKLTAEDGSTLSLKANTSPSAAYQINGNCVMMRAKDDSFITITFKGGVKDFSFDYKGVYNSKDKRKMVIYEGDKDSNKEIGSTDEFAVTSVLKYKKTLNKTGDYTITIKEAGSPSVVLDNITWTK